MQVVGLSFAVRVMNILTKGDDWIKFSLRTELAHG